MTNLTLPRGTPRVAVYLHAGIMGDSQTQPWPIYATRGTRMHSCGLAKRLRRDRQVPIREHAYGIAGDTTAGMLLRSDDLLNPMYWPLVLVVLYGGVNDPGYQVLPTITPSAAGGTIPGGLYYALAFVSASPLTGFALTMPIQTVFVPAGAAGSIALSIYTQIALQAGTGLYVSPTGFASAALAAAADTRTFLFVTTLTGAAYTITAIPAGTAAKCPSASTQANLQAMTKVVKYGVAGFGPGSRLGGIVYPSQTNLPAEGADGMRCVVMDDTSATGGLAAIAHSNQHPTITGSFVGNARQSVWEYRTPLAGESGWGRVAVAGTPPFSGCCSRILIVSPNYQNYLNGLGDSYNVLTGNGFLTGTNTDSGTPGTQFAAYVPIRAAAAAAASAEGADGSALFVDLYAYQSKILAAGLEGTVQNDNKWHRLANNQHHDTYGHEIVVRAELDVIIAAGWDTALADPNYVYVR